MNYIFISLFHLPMPLIYIDLLSYHKKYRHLRLLHLKNVNLISISNPTDNDNHICKFTD